MTKDEFILLQSRRSVRATRKTTSRKGSDVTNLFSGLLFCGYCGSRITISGYTSQRTKIQTKYFACHCARTGSSTCRMHAWEIKDLEPALLFWLTQVDYGKLVGTRGRSDIDLERQQLAVLEKQATVMREARRTFATSLIERGVDIKAVSSLMGHSTVAMTAKYVDDNPVRLRKVCESVAVGV